VLATTKLLKISKSALSNDTVVILLSVMARPKSIDPTARHARTVVLGVRFSERQMKSLRKKAKAKGMSVAQLVRVAAMRQAA
jgi:hypothetical protein